MTQDFEAVKAAHEEIVPTMVEQIEINQFSNSFDYFKVLIEELKNHRMIISQQLEAPMVRQVKTMAKRVQ